MNASRVGVSLLLLVSLVGCSSGSGSGGGPATGGGAGAGGNSTGGMGGAAGSNTGGGAGTAGSAGTGATGGGGSGGSAPGSWSVIENDYLYGTKAVVAHSSDPSRVAFLLERSPSAPGTPLKVSVATSNDGGKTLEFADVMDIPDTAYMDGHGMVWSPDDDQLLAAAVGFPYGFDYADLWRLLRSDNAGKSFTPTSIVQLDKLKWVPGSPGALVARVDGQIQKSSDFGATFGAAEALPSGCGAAVDYTESSTHHLFACGSDGIQACQGTSCQAAALPVGSGNAYGVEAVPGDPTHVVALAGVSQDSQLLLSTDGGLSFQSVQALGTENSWHLYVDPRPTGTVVIALGITQHGVWRSADAGATFTDITPPLSLPNGRGLSTLAYEAAVTADGGVVAYTAPGVLRYTP